MGVSRLFTPGVIAAELRVPLGRILHVLRTRPHIRPAARAGTLRIFDNRAVAMIRYELNKIDAQREARRCQRREGAADHA